jgi:hypothetical protein
MRSYSHLNLLRFFAAILSIITATHAAGAATPALRQIFYDRVRAAQLQAHRQGPSLLIEQSANPKTKAKCDRYFNQYLLKCVSSPAE